MGTGIHNAKVEGIKEGGELPRLCNFIAESAIRFLSKLSCRWRRSYRAAHHRQGFHGLYVELKRQKGGSLESSQEDIIARLRQAGYRVEVCMGWWEAREAIENYLTGALPQASGGRA